MLPRVPTPSSRLRKAAEAERQQLAHHRRELLQERESLRAELDRIESSLAQVTERETLLDQLVGVPGGGDHTEAGTDLKERSAHGDDRHETVGLTVLRGPEIRREAVRLLLTHPGRPEALHYRDWYALLQEAGFVAGGKDPLATFLTQLSRSPAVRKSTQAGIYELDRDAPRRLRRRRDEVQQELRKLTATQTSDSERAVIRARRTELNTELGRVEKSLEEVEALFKVAHEPAIAA